MATHYKLGCNWGSDNPSFYEYIREHNIVIGDGNKAKYNAGDLVLVTEGFTARAVVRISESSIPITEYEYGKELSDNYGVHFEDWVDTYVGEWMIIGEGEQFQYKTQQGIVEIQKDDIRSQIKTIEAKRDRYKVLNTYIDILKHKKQIVLQGAPGTGKTYVSADIAMGLINPDKQYSTRDELMADYKKAVKAGQIAFTTFHQSMDYEEFVEGLKPSVDNGEVRYDVEPGIFKKICTDALAPTSNFEESYNRLISDIESLEEDYLVLKTSTGKEFAVSVNSKNNLRLHTGPEKKVQGVLTKENIQSTIGGIYPFAGWHSYFGGVTEYLKSQYGLNVKAEEAVKNYVLIIDEINRGNISKIFGELITLLENDKRIGETNEVRVKLPYSSDKEPFGVPSNLYIIGTMNTADRSVGHIDYAIRRRFSFITLTSSETAIKGFYGDSEVGQKALRLFNDVHDIMKHLAPDFDAEDLMVGHSYFMAKNEDELEMKLNYEIKPLLSEYLKDGILKVTATEAMEQLAL